MSVMSLLQARVRSQSVYIILAMLYRALPCVTLEAAAENLRIAHVVSRQPQGII